jgi:hypothetical protein
MLSTNRNDVKSTPEPGTCISVENASFSFTSTEDSQDFCFFKWDSGQIATSQKQEKGIPFNGDYTNISAKFEYGENEESKFITKNATFTYDGKIITWKKGGAPENIQEGKIDASS